jgi:hypothetical protein
LFWGPWVPYFLRKKWGPGAVLVCCHITIRCQGRTCVLCMVVVECTPTRGGYMHVDVALGGSFVRLRGVGPNQGRERDYEHVRGPIRGFSKQSRKRYFDLFNSLDRQGPRPTLLLTLTYSDSSYGRSWQECKADLRAFRSRFERRYGRVPYFWRLEHKPRQSGQHVGQLMPHFHLLVFGQERVDKDWLRGAWSEVVSNGAELVRTNVRPVYDWRGAGCYLSKDLAKEQTTDVATGRVWGVVNKAMLFIRMVTVALSQLQFYKLRRALRGWLTRKLDRRLCWGKARGQGLTCYVDSDVGVRLLASLLQD